MLRKVYLNSRGQESAIVYELSSVDDCITVNRIEVTIHCDKCLLVFGWGKQKNRNRLLERPRFSK